MAQLGARFHGMEEVVSSNLTRSTKTFQTLTVPLIAQNAVTGVQVEPKKERRGPERSIAIADQFRA